MENLKEAIDNLSFAPRRRSSEREQEFNHQPANGMYSNYSYRIDID